MEAGGQPRGIEKGRGVVRPAPCVPGGVCGPVPPEPQRRSSSRTPLPGVLPDVLPDICEACASRR